jgi:hypothetical protein
MRRRAATRGAAAWQVLAAATLACCGLAACAVSTVNRGADFYRQGHYIDADQLFEHSEPDLIGLAPAERARYALYRGATYLALGDHTQARRWLGYGAELASTPAARLSSAEQQLLVTSLRTVQGYGAALNAATSTVATGTGMALRGLRLGP